MKMASCRSRRARTCHGGQRRTTLATYLQGTIEQRQSWTKAKIAAIWDELDMAAVKLGYADTDAAHTALVAIPEANWTNSQRLFLSSFTNVEFVDSEGSYGIHNWAYSVRIVNTAMNQAKAVTAPSLASGSSASRRPGTTVNKNRQKVYFRGAVQTGWGIAAPARSSCSAGWRARAGGTGSRRPSRRTVLLQDRAEAELQEGQVVLPYRHARRRWAQPHQQQPQRRRQSQIDSLPALSR